jgi:hypothetical protein
MANQMLIEDCVIGDAAIEVEERGQKCVVGDVDVFFTKCGIAIAPPSKMLRQVRDCSSIGTTSQGPTTLTPSTAAALFEQLLISAKRKS